MAENSVSQSIDAAGKEKHEPTALEKHVMFFDINKDGIIYPWETFQGFRAIGCGLLLSVVASIFINVGLGSKTRPGMSFSILFPIQIKNIHLAKHGSDSGVYDNEGRFVASKFEELFKKHAISNKDSLTSEELRQFLQANRAPKDYAGWVAAFAEWKVLYILCKDKQGLLHKETVRGAFDGSLFEQMAKDNASKKQS